MFKFLKEKISGAIERFSKKAEEIPEEKANELIKESPVKKAEEKSFITKLKEKVTATKISETKFNELFWEFELAMLENNVAVEVIEKIKRDLKLELVDVPINRSGIRQKIISALRESISNLFKGNDMDLIKVVKASKKPYVILFLGINGTGKTTTLAKFAKLLQDNNLSSVISASDTFRAAAIQQLEEHGENLGVRVIKSNYGSDPAAVAFDAIKYAEAKRIDVVLIDTAGRMQSNKNLLDEMKKIIRVSKPDLKLFVGESIAGNDVVEQSKTFNETVGIDGIILSKADIDEKGGAAMSVSYITGKPILYLGCGQSYNDLDRFNKEKLLKSLGL
jgi:fused signal recognition particle receptor